MEIDEWIIEVRPNNEWKPVKESWFSNKLGGPDAVTPMRPRSMVDCSEKAVEARNVFVSYREGSMRLRNVHSEEIVPFEIFT